MGPVTRQGTERVERFRLDRRLPRGRIAALAGASLVVLGLYLALWPVPVRPVAWRAPPSPGYTGVFARNERLAGVSLLPLEHLHGPEDVTLDAGGTLYAATAEGIIVRAGSDRRVIERWADTGGRPLGLRFDPAGRLVVADAYRGLLAIGRDRGIEVIAAEADGVPIRYANSVAIADDGRIFLTDSSTKFGAQEWGGTYQASLLDILEHGGHGRLLVYDPTTRRASTLVDGLDFPNGLALDPEGRFVLISETGAYRILRHWLSGPRRGQTEPLVEALPGFPDNLSTGLDGRFWVSLISPRNALLDSIADRPFLRKVVQRLPAALRPQAVSYGHVLAFDAGGRITVSLQDPAGGYPLVTSVVESPEALYLGSLVAPAIARLPSPFRRPPP